jgi:transcriptional regulator with XRE-family HTH domain
MNESENTEINRLKKIRLALNLNQHDFAKSIGLTQGGYSDIERGKNGISGKVKTMLILVHKVNRSYLEKGQGEMFFIELKDDDYDLKVIGDPNNDTKDGLIELLKSEIKRLKSEKELYIELIQTKDKTIEALDKTIEALEKQIKK